MRVRLKSILCTTDFSDYSNQIVSYGAAIAKEFDARLLICHIIDLQFAAIYGTVHFLPPDLQIQSVETAQEQIEELMRPQSVPWEAVVATGPPADEIARVVQDRAIDLAISATHGRTGLKRFILGSVTERLMRSLTCPLLVVRETPPELMPDPARGLRFNKILVGCDFSPAANAALEYGVSLAQEFEAELHLIHVLEPQVYSDFLATALDETHGNTDDIKEQLDRRLTDLITPEVMNWCRVKTVVIEGRPFEAITGYAGERGIDLVVLGVRGHGVVETLFLGSTTDRVIRKSQCPVLSVNPSE
ncbi:MAG: universal stress protein [Desulfobacterales bacterium]|nr:universal stress protein [Desulfobacterales bacterium]